MLVTREAEDRSQKNVGWTLGHAGFYLIFSSGSSVFIPKYSGILSGSAPVCAISRRSSAFSSVILGAYFGSSIRFLVSSGSFFKLYSSALYRSGLLSPLG